MIHSTGFFKCIIHKGKEWVFFLWKQILNRKIWSLIYWLVQLIPSLLNKENYIMLKSTLNWLVNKLKYSVSFDFLTIQQCSLLFKLDPRKVNVDPSLPWYDLLYQTSGRDVLCVLSLTLRETNGLLFFIFISIFE